MSESTDAYWVEGEMIPADLGATIKHIRERHLKLSQNELAKAIDVKAETLKICENGNGNHIYSILMKICRKYNLKTICRIKS